MAKKSKDTRAFVTIEDIGRFPDFSKWTMEQLRAEAKRLGMPGWEKATRGEMIDNLSDAWS